MFVSSNNMRRSDLSQTIITKISVRALIARATGDSCGPACSPTLAYR